MAKDKCGKTIKTVKTVDCDGNPVDVPLGTFGKPCPERKPSTAFRPKKKQ
jgi:hypothetical protein